MTFLAKNGNNLTKVCIWHIFSNRGILTGTQLTHDDTVMTQDDTVLQHVDTVVTQNETKLKHDPPQNRPQNQQVDTH